MQKHFRGESPEVREAHTRIESAVLELMIAAGRRLPRATTFAEFLLSINDRGEDSDRATEKP